MEGVKYFGAILSFQRVDKLRWDGSEYRIVRCGCYGLEWKVKTFVSNMLVVVD